MEFKGSDRGPFVPALIVVDMQEDFCPPVSEPSLLLTELLKYGERL